MPNGERLLPIKFTTQPQKVEWKNSNIVLPICWKGNFVINMENTDRCTGTYTRCSIMYDIFTISHLHILYTLLRDFLCYQETKHIKSSKETIELNNRIYFSISIDTIRRITNVVVLLKLLYLYMYIKFKYRYRKHRLTPHVLPIVPIL